MSTTKPRATSTSAPVGVSTRFEEHILFTFCGREVRRKSAATSEHFADEIVSNVLSFQSVLLKWLRSCLFSVSCRLDFPDQAQPLGDFVQYLLLVRLSLAKCNHIVQPGRSLLDFPEHFQLKSNYLYDKSKLVAFLRSSMGSAAPSALGSGLSSQFPSSTSSMPLISACSRTFCLSQGSFVGGGGTYL